MMIESTYHLKWISWNSGMIPIVMQSMNGPCPLIATMNVLLLREKIKLPDMLEQITEAQLLTYIGESIMDTVPPTNMQNDENYLLNLEQNIHDAIEILPKLKSGLDVNIRFAGITDFENTPECIIFDLLRIPLYHGWLTDPSSSVLQDAIGNLSYNQLVDFIITNKASPDPLISTKILVAEEFLERTASQLTMHGLEELRGKIMDNEIGILFRNNHFLTLFKRDGEIYTLVTDHGYLTEFNIVWETLDSIEGAGVFFDANFQLSELVNRQAQANKEAQREQQLVNDYLVALSLKEDEIKQAGPEAAEMRRQLELNDLEMAKRLQEEEDGLVDSNRLCSREMVPQTSLIPFKSSDQIPASASSSHEPMPGHAPRLVQTDSQPERLPAMNVAGTSATTLDDTTDLLAPDHQTFPMLVPTPEQQVSSHDERTNRMVVEPEEGSPSPNCVEVVQQLPQTRDLANEYPNQGKAIELISPLTYAGVTNPTRGQSADSSAQRSDAPATNQQQRQPSSGRNGSNKPRSEKGRESTCRVH